MTTGYFCSNSLAVMTAKLLRFKLNDWRGRALGDASVAGPTRVRDQARGATAGRRRHLREAAPRLRDLGRY